MAVNDLLSDKQLPVPVGPRSLSGCVEKEANVFSAPTIEPGFLGRPTCVLTIIVTAVWLYSHLGFGQTRDQVLHPCQTLNVKLYVHFVYISIVVFFFFSRKKRGNAGDPLNGSYAVSNAVRNFVCYCFMVSSADI